MPVGDTRNYLCARFSSLLVFLPRFLLRFDPQSLWHFYHSRSAHQKVNDDNDKHFKSKHFLHTHSHNDPTENRTGTCNISEVIVILHPRHRDPSSPSLPVPWLLPSVHWLINISFSLILLLLLLWANTLINFFPWTSLAWQLFSAVNPPSPWPSFPLPLPLRRPGLDLFIRVIWLCLMCVESLHELNYLLIFTWVRVNFVYLSFPSLLLLLLIALPQIEISWYMEGWRGRGRVELKFQLTVGLAQRGTHWNLSETRVESVKVSVSVAVSFGAHLTRSTLTLTLTCSAALWSFATFT